MKLNGSFRKIIPMNAVPNAPMPTQTPYAVPIGNFTAAIDKSHILQKRAANVNKLGVNLVKPSVYFKPMAQITSKKPAMINTSQDFVIKTFPH